MRGEQQFLSFNRGRISRLAMARTDIKRSALAASVMTNWMPRTLGSMMLRPGLQYIDTLTGNPSTNIPALIPFVFSATETALVVVNYLSVSFVVDDVMVTRPTVTAAITNPTFTSDLSGWTVAGTAVWSGGDASLTGDGTNIASILQAVTINENNTEHALHIVVISGTVVLRVGSTSNGTEYIDDYTLGPGNHSIAFTVTSGSFYVKLYNQTEFAAVVSKVDIESGGDLALANTFQPLLYPTTDPSGVRFDQSGDILFITSAWSLPHKIIRHDSDSRSWSFETYIPIDGPFLLENTGTTTITPSALDGDVTLTSSTVSSTGIFSIYNWHSLYSVTSVGQTVIDSFTSENDFTGHIRVTGIGDTRTFAITVDGTFTANVTLQRSIDEGASWVDVATYTTITATSLTDGLDDQIVWYRIGVKTGGYTFGTASCALVYDAGSITGVARVTGFTSSSVVTAQVLVPFGGTTASSAWAEGSWSFRRGGPTAVGFHDGRLFWAGRDRFWGSVTDQYYTFDANFEGDAGPIARSIGYGTVDNVHWLLSLDRLIAGTDSSIVTCRSSSSNEPLTPTNFTPKRSVNIGSANIQAVQVDGGAYFVGADGGTLWELKYNDASLDYVPEDLTAIVPEIGAAGFTRLAVQRRPDTRIHCVRADGTVALLLFDRQENVICWCDIETDGVVIDVCVLPGTTEDSVYYIVYRTVNGSSSYYLEKWAQESECIGGAINKLADSFVYAAAASNVITGLDHLEGEEVVAWGGGAYLGTFTVASGSITLHATTTYTNRTAGLGYQAQWKSTKLAYAAGNRSGLLLKKKIDRLGLVMVDTHAQGLEYGRTFAATDPMPQTDRYGDVDQDSIWDEYDSQSFAFPGQWDTDSRLCLVANAPKPCTLLGVVIEMDTNAK